MNQQRDVWKRIEELVSRGERPTERLVLKAARRGKKLEQQLRMIKNYKEARDVGNEVVFTRDALFKLCDTLVLEGARPL